MRTLSELRIYLFGPPRIERDGVSINIGLRKAEAMLVYLAVTGHRHGRDALAALFWPEDDQHKAHANLRRAIWRLNKVLGEGVLEADRWHVSLAQDTEIWVDVRCFRDCIAETEAHGHGADMVCPDCAALLTQAASCYADDFLAGFSLPNCPEFDEWQYFQYGDLRESYATVLEKLAGVYRAHQDVHRAIAAALRRLALDPLHEPTHRLLMELYALSDQKSAALRQYEECAHTLNVELNALPSEETRSLNDAIQAGEYPPVAPDAPATDLSQFAINTRYDMPHQPTSFVGRATELARISELLDNPACRLLTLVGPGGIGKTRLAIRSAEGFSERMAQGAALVSLDAVQIEKAQDAGDPVVAAIADSLRINFHDGDEPEHQLLAYLHQKELLLVLDNAEHLLDSMRVVAYFLAHAPDVKVMVTSRERLRLRDEWLFPVTGMAYPERDQRGQSAISEVDASEVGASTSDASSGQYSAVDLFLARACQVQPDFEPEKESVAIRRICRLVEGMPLAVELAASWTRVLSCREIAEEIEKGIGFLATDLHNVAERHRSIQAVVEYSWLLLSDDEQDVLQRLSLFRGGFSRAAAEYVAGATLQHLSSLADKSLIQYTSARRYGFHALVREFAESRLKASPDQYAATRKAHAEYYAGYLTERRTDLEGRRQLEALSEMEVEIESIRTFWKWAIEYSDMSKLNDTLPALVYYHEYRGLFREGESACRRAANAVRQANMLANTDQLERYAATLGNLLNNQGWFAWRCGLDGAAALMEEGVALLRQAGPEAQWDLAAALDILALRVGFDDLARGDALHREALTLAEQDGDPFLIAYVKMSLGQTAQERGEYRNAGPLLRESLVFFEKIGEQRFRSYSTNSLGRVALAMGQYDEAKTYLQQAFEIRKLFTDRIGMAYSLLDLGKYAKLRGRYAEAQRHIDAATELCDEIGAVVVKMQCMLELGDLARRAGEIGQAKTSLQYAVDLIKEMRLPALIPVCSNFMARLALVQDNLAEAEYYAREGLAISRRVGHSGEKTAALCILGHIAVAHGRAGRAEAEKRFCEAWTIAERTGAAPIALDVMLGRASLFLSDNPQDRALRQAIDLLAIVQQHPAGEQSTRERAANLLETCQLDDREQQETAAEMTDDAFWRSGAALFART